MANTTEEKGKRKGFFSNLFTEVDTGTAAEQAKNEFNITEFTQKPIIQAPEVSLDSSADQIIEHALDSLKGDKATVIYLKGLIDVLPLGTPKENIESMLKFNGVSKESIQADASKRIALLNGTLKNLESHQKEKISELEGEIIELETIIDQKKKEIRSISELTVTVRQKITQLFADIEKVMLNIE